MAGFDYAKSAATADRLIKRFGQAATLIRQVHIGGPDYDPTFAKQSRDCTVAVLEYENREIDGSRIQTGDKKVLVSAVGLSPEPSTADRIDIGGEEHAVVSVKPLSPAGTAVFYEVQARR